MTGEVVYEVRLAVDGASDAEVDAWLGPHIDAMLALPGFVDCEVSVPSEDDAGTAGAPIRRVTRYRLRNRQALERYLDEHAAAMRAEGIERFGEALNAEREVFGLTRASSVPQCLNCGAPLTSQYCAECGQRSTTRLISLWQLIADALGDVIDVDSRLWRTLRSLTLRPGHLTREYLNGRRAAYMPPFRTYLFMSLVFFVLLTVLPDRDDVDEAPSADEIAARITEESAVRTASDDPQADPPVQDRDEQSESTPQDDGVQIRTDNEDCHVFGVRVGDNLFVSEARIHEICDRMEEDGFWTTVFEDVRERVPTAVFFFLPLIAFVLKLLYPLSRRYYVEHLLFIVHFQAFLFLALSVNTVFEAAVTVLPILSVPETVFSIALVLYVPYYLYRAMREVYNQGRLATVGKYFVLVIAYFVAALIVLVGATVLSILSV